MFGKEEHASRIYHLASVEHGVHQHSPNKMGAVCFVNLHTIFYVSKLLSRAYTCSATFCFELHLAYRARPILLLPASDKIGLAR